jgi:hypothetical protein
VLGKAMKRRDVRRALIGAAVVVALVAAGVGVGLSHRHSPVPIAPIGTHGYDVSWPQCAGADAHNMPAGTPAYVILGLSNVHDHTVNPCVADQLAWAHDHGVRVGAYLLASYPTKAEQLASDSGPAGACDRAVRCELRNDGAAQARLALATMARTGIRAPRIWIDVEVRTVNPWSRSTRHNAVLIDAIVRGLRTAHVGTGIYTTSYQWQQIAGDHQVQVPNWLPVGAESSSQAAALCSRSATGGPTWLVQYTQALDEDLTCPILDLPGVHAQQTPSGAKGESRAQRDLQLSRFVHPS